MLLQLIYNKPQPLVAENYYLKAKEKQDDSLTWPYRTVCQFSVPQSSYTGYTQKRGQIKTKNSFYPPMRQNVLQQSWVWRVENKKHENALSWHHFSKVETQMMTRGSPLPLYSQQHLSMHKVTTENILDGLNLLLEHKMEMNRPTLRCLKGFDPRPVSRENRPICHIRISFFLLKILHSVCILKKNP